MLRERREKEEKKTEPQTWDGKALLKLDSWHTLKLLLAIIRTDTEINYFELNKDFIE